jgi:hypothetical protein
VGCGSLDLEPAAPGAGALLGPAPKAVTPAILTYAAPDPIRFREFIYSLTQRLSRAGISPVMTSETPDLFNIDRLAEYGISHLSDNVVVLQYLRADSRRGSARGSRRSSARLVIAHSSSHER